MAGVQGMGNPADIQPAMQPPATTPVNIPAAAPVQASNPLDEIYSSAPVQTSASSGNPLDEIYGVSAPTASSGNFGERLVDDLKGVGSAVMDGLEYAENVVLSPVRGAAAEVAKSVDGRPLKLLDPTLPGKAGLGIVKGLWSPQSQPTIEESAKKAVPELGKVTIKIPAQAFSPENLQDFNTSHSSVKDVLSQSWVDSEVTPAQALDFVASTVGAEGVQKVITGAGPVLAKNAGKAIKAVGDKISSYRSLNKAEMAANPGLAIKADLDALKFAEEDFNSLDNLLNVTHKNPADPKIKKLGEAVSESAEIQALENIAGQRITNVVDNIAKLKSNLVGKVASTDEIYDTVSGASRGQGKELQRIRELASKELGSRPLQANKLKAQLAKSYELLTNPDGMKKVVITNERKAEELKDYLEGLENIFLRNPDGISYDKWNEIRAGLKVKADAAFAGSSNDAANIYGSLRTALSRDEDGFIAEGLKVIEPQTSAKFTESIKSNYHGILNAYDELGAMIEKDGITGKALLKATYFSEGADAINKTRNMNKVLGIEKPELVQAFRYRALEHLRNISRNKNISPENPFETDFNSYAENIFKLNGDSTVATKNNTMLKELLGSEAKAAAMLDFAKNLKLFAQNTKGRKEPITGALIKRLYYAAKKVNPTNPGPLLEPLMQQWDASKNLKSVLSTVDVNYVTKGMPDKEKAELIKMFENAVK